MSPDFRRESADVDEFVDCRLDFGTKTLVDQESSFPYTSYRTGVDIGDKGAFALAHRMPSKQRLLCAGNTVSLTIPYAPLCSVSMNFRRTLRV